MNNMQTISLCMIVKNEEKFLQKCIKSAQPLVDEIVIVDTGSTDKTMDIALEQGAKVYQHPWQNSFSKARNHALKYVTGDWVLQLDADEELEAQDIPLTRQLVQSFDYHAIYVAIYNYLPRGRSKLYFPRLFRRGKAHYEGIVHNQVVYEGKPLYSEIRIHHYGYNLPTEKMVVKYERSRKLLEEQLAADPENIFAWYNLIRLYKNQRNFSLSAEKGMEIVEKFSPAKSINIYLMILNDTIVSLFNMNSFDLAIHYCNLALKLKPDYFDVLYSLGMCYLKQKLYNRAAVNFIKFIKTVDKERASPKTNLLDVGTIDYIDIAYAHLGECQLYLGDEEKANESFQRALEEFQSRIKNITLNKVHPEVLSVMAKVGIYLHNFKIAADYYEICLKQFPSNPQWLNNLASCYAKMGKKDAACLGYLAALKINPHYQDAKLNLFALNKGLQSLVT